MRVLVLGGAGFIGRHVAQALRDRGHTVTVGSRYPERLAQAAGDAVRAVRMERLLSASAWRGLLQGMDAVVNCVGILRQRGRETYERVHHLAPAALARACAQTGVRRLIHISALGLHADARSGFITSKRAGEAAIPQAGLDWTIVRPSLLNGSGGFGARWMQAMARLPLHVVPAEARGRIAALDVKDLGEAVARLCETPHTAHASAEERTVELGGTELRTMRELLAALRRVHTERPALCLTLPPWLARVLSHACDLLHVSPYSFGHLELMRRDNAPRVNRLPELLGRAPRGVGREAEAVALGSSPASNCASSQA